jgi:hypothetical protein
MAYQDILRTKLQWSNTRAVWEDKRRKRILEAMSWESGTEDKPRKHLIATLPNNIEVYFLKPGKEVFNKKRPNPYDMFPVVGAPEIKPKFEDIWSHLSRIAVINFDSFKAVLTLIYRSAYLIDHLEKEAGIIRYEPNDAITKCVHNINKEIGNASPFGLMGLLHFLDILGWNEDMKYHIENNKPTFSGKYDFKVGRINTLLTCVRVPYQASLFVRHCIEKASDKKNINFSLLYTIMQQFAKSRGTCTPTQQQLTEWLSPYVVGEKHFFL